MSGVVSHKLVKVIATIVVIFDNFVVIVCVVANDSCHFRHRASLPD
jgi:hypothetical protein